MKAFSSCHNYVSLKYDCSRSKCLCLSFLFFLKKIMIETLIFDMEGVVIDSEGLWDRAQEILLKRRNLIYEKDKIKVLLTGKSLQEGISIIKDFYNLKESVDTLFVERNILFKDWIKKLILSRVF